MLIERKTVCYYPRSRFWKFWEKRKPLFIVIRTGNESLAKSFFKDGALRRLYFRRENGFSLERIYFPNGCPQESTMHSPDKTRYVTWDENGQMILDKREDKKAQVETHYHPNGLLKMRHNRRTGAYEEWTETGVLKKRGLWLDERNNPTDLGMVCSRFVTGNMCEKEKDELRQEYNEAIDSINYLPPTAGRKTAKKALAREYRKATGYHKPRHPQTKRKNATGRQELPFAPVDSKITIDLSPERFAHSIAFSEMMDRAHRLAMRRNDSFGSRSQGHER